VTLNPHADMLHGQLAISLGRCHGDELALGAKGPYICRLGSVMG